MKIFFNLALFQAGWWATVFLVSAGHPLSAFFTLIALSLVHLIIFSLEGETEFVIKATLLGYLTDSLLHYFSWITFLPRVESFPHPWLFGLWLLLSCTLLHSLRWITKKKLLGILSSAIMGPLTYYLVSLEYSFIQYPTNPLTTLTLQALAWSGLVYLFSKLIPQGQTMQKKFDSKHVVITGASRGIGLALAQEMAKRKVALHLIARSISEEQVSQLKARGAKEVYLYQKDLTLTSQVDELFDELSKFPIEVLFNNAGQLTGGLLEEQNPDEIEKMLSINVNTLIRLTRLFLPSFLARKDGIIVNNSSVSGKMFFPCASTYAASKAAVVAFTESLSQELEGTGISAHLMITPGVKTKMFDDISGLYGGHLDLGFMSSITAEQWAQKVITSIEAGDKIIWPSGSTNLGVKFAHHFPRFFEKMVATKFKR